MSDSLFDAPDELGLTQDQIVEELKRSGAAVESSRRAPVQAPPPEPAPPPVPEPGEPEADLARVVRERTALPDEATKVALKKQYGKSLTVVPFLSEDDNKKMQAVIVKPLTRSEWRAAEEAAQKLAESKPGRAPLDIFQERIVTRAVVWPKNMFEPTADQVRAGLVPTIYGVVERISWFYDVDTLMSLTFTL